MKEIDLLHALLRFNDPFDVVFVDKDDHLISRVTWENITDIKTSLYGELVKVIKLKPVRVGRNQFKMKFLNDSWRDKI